MTTGSECGMNGPFWPTGNEYAKGEVVVEDAVLNRGQQLCLLIFSLASSIDVGVDRV